MLISDLRIRVIWAIQEKWAQESEQELKDRKARDVGSMMLLLLMILGTAKFLETYISDPSFELVMNGSIITIVAIHVYIYNYIHPCQVTSWFITKLVGTTQGLAMVS